MSYRKKTNPAKQPPTIEQLELYPEYRNPAEQRMLSTAVLHSGQPYQRPVTEHDVDDLIRKWNITLMDPLVVSFRDGKFHIVDGQHRAACLRKMNGGKDVLVECRIYRDLTYEKEAELCYLLDKAKNRLNISQSTKALVESGADTEIIEIKRLVEDAGFEWALGSKSGKEFEICVTRAVINAYKLLGGTAFTRMLDLLRDTWCGDPSSLSAAMLSGMALFLKTHETELNDNTFIKRLSLIDPEEIIRRGKVDFTTNSVALRIARVLHDKYNKGRGGCKLPYRFNG